MKTINLGKISVPVDQYASQGNAVLGIRGSGKSYSATYVAERLLDAGVPIVAFDPIGIWRFLRVPADGGAGYRVVVAGGEHADIPLPAHGAAEIMRAAMRDGVSIVFDLYDIHLSKGDWRRVVESAVKVMLYENKAHGLRHIFLEEAAEFCPQRIAPDQGGVYSAIERLARMGGNAQLGYTIINQRAEEVNKAVLELCDLLILHRQKGRNSLTALGKWLDVAQAKGEIAEKIPVLDNGECYIWPAGDAQPVRTKIPAKRTFHPDRKAMAQAVIAEAKTADVSAFVATMCASLEALTKEAEANDPKRLKARIAELERGAGGAVDVGLIVEAENNGYSRGREDGFKLGKETAYEPYARAVAELSDIVKRARTLESSLGTDLELLHVTSAKDVAPLFSDRRTVVTSPEKARQLSAVLLRQADRQPSGKGLDRAQRAFMTALAQQARPLTRNQVAIFAGYSATSRHVDNTLASLRARGLVEGGSDGIAITREGLAALGHYDPLPTGRALREYWVHELDMAAGKFLNVICDAYPAALTRDEIAERAEYSTTSRHVDNTLAVLRARELVIGGRAAIRASDNLF